MCGFTGRAGFKDDGRHSLCMKHHLALISLAAIALVGAFVACKPKGAHVAAPVDVPASSGQAPAWRLRDLAGKEVSSDVFKGKVVVLDFWATWCPPCRAEIPGYIELQKKYAQDGFAIVGVSLDEGGPEAVAKFVEKNKMNYTVVMGNDDTVQAFGGFEAIPTTFLIDRTGNIVHRKTGAMGRDEYEKVLRPYLK